MDYFGAETKLVDLVFSNYRILPVLNRLGVNVGLGEITVEQLCQKNNMDIGFFLAIVNLYNDKDLLPEEEFLKFPLKDLIDFLVSSHEYYRNDIIVKHHDLFFTLKESSLKSIDGIDKIYELYKEELESFVDHMDYEDKVVFPFLLNLEGKENKDEEAYKISKNVADFHIGLMEQLYDMKSILLKYVYSESDIHVSNELLVSLFHFAEDLDIHSKIENSILLRYLKK